MRTQIRGTGVFPYKLKKSRKKHFAFHPSSSLHSACSKNEERLVRNRRLGFSNQERHGTFGHRFVLLWNWFNSKNHVKAIVQCWLMWCNRWARTKERLYPASLPLIRQLSRAHWTLTSSFFFRGLPWSSFQWFEIWIAHWAKQQKLDLKRRRLPVYSFDSSTLFLD